MDTATNTANNDSSPVKLVGNQVNETSMNNHDGHDQSALSADLHSTTSTELFTAATSLSCESSAERTTNIPRNSRTSDIQVSQQLNSQQSSTASSVDDVVDSVPTAANSRSFFLNRESQKTSTSQPTKTESAVPSPPEPNPPTILTSEQLAAVVHLAAVEDCCEFNC